MMKDEHTDVREYGLQRVDTLMNLWHVDNHDLTEAVGEEEQLTHKQVQRARKGRRLTLKMMQKITRALNAAVNQRVTLKDGEQLYVYVHRDLFSYAKGYDPVWQDPNSRYYPKV